MTTTLDRYTAPSANSVLVAGPHSGPGRAERAKQRLSTSQGRNPTHIGTSRASPWLARWCGAGVLALLLPVTAHAHVSITPRASTHGATERYTVRIPTEGNVTTTGAELDVPEGVIVEVVQAPAGWKHELKRRDDRIVAMAWHVEVKPGEFIEVGFVARNPRQGDRIVWTLRQRFADGTVTDWTVDPKGAVRPTAVTRLTSAPRP